MSWFRLGDVDRRYWRGLCLDRHPAVMEGYPALQQAVADTNAMREGEWIHRIEIKEVRRDDHVVLEVWCQNPDDMRAGVDRYNVFWVLIPADKDWPIRSGLGRAARWNGNLPPKKEGNAL